MICELDNISRVYSQARKYEVNRHGEKGAERVSGQEEFSHYECREHEQKFMEWPQVLLHLKDGKN